MSILNRVRQAKDGIDTIEKYAQAGDKLFGSKPRVETRPAVDYEPEDFSHDQAYQQTENQYQEPNSRFTPEQLNWGRQFMQSQGVSQHEFRADHGFKVSDDHLRSLARLKIATEKLKMNFKTEPLRHFSAFAFKKLGKPELAAEIKDLDIDDGYEELNELLVEVQFLEMKDLQRANNFRMPSASEIMKNRYWMYLEKLAGEGFKNVVELGEAGFTKIEKMVNGKR